MSFEISERDENRMEPWAEPISIEQNTLHWFEMLLLKFYAKIRKRETKDAKPPSLRVAVKPPNLQFYFWKKTTIKSI